MTLPGSTAIVDSGGGGEAPAGLADCHDSIPDINVRDGVPIVLSVYYHGDLNNKLEWSLHRPDDTGSPPPNLVHRQACAFDVAIPVIDRAVWSRDRGGSITGTISLGCIFSPNTRHAFAVPISIAPAAEASWVDAGTPADQVVQVGSTATFAAPVSIHSGSGEQLA